MMLSDLIGATVEIVPYLSTGDRKRGVIRALVVMPPVVTTSAHVVCAVVQLDGGRLETVNVAYLQVVSHAL